MLTSVLLRLSPIFAMFALGFGTLVLAGVVLGVVVVNVACVRLKERLGKMWRRSAEPNARQA
jgi:hypothetical protein